MLPEPMRSIGEVTKSIVAGMEMTGGRHEQYEA